MPSKVVISITAAQATALHTIAATKPTSVSQVGYREFDSLKARQWADGGWDKPPRLTPLGKHAYELTKALK